MTVAIFDGVTFRALTVEQLNANQWHVVLRGADAPHGSWESRATGAEPFAQAVADALDKADLTGLPVFVQAYGKPPRPLASIAPPRSFARRVRGRSSLNEIMFGRGTA